MLFLVEIDLVRSGLPVTPEAVRTFIEKTILPTIARSEQLLAEKKIVAGGPVAGRVALRLMIEAESLERLDRLLTGLPLWRVAETRVTPLISFSDRRNHVQALRKAVGAAR
jgi:muconolactone delta-isomerase